MKLRLSTDIIPSIINKSKCNKFTVLIENYRSSWPDQLYMINKKLVLNPTLSQQFDYVIKKNSTNDNDEVNINPKSENGTTTIVKSFLPQRTVDPDLLTFQFSTNFTRGTSFFYSHLDLHPGDYKVVLLVIIVFILLM